MNELIKRIKDLLTESENCMTIPQICKNLNIDDEFDVLSAIGDLESTNEVVMKNMKKFYRPDGSAAYLAEYGCV